MQKPSVAHVTYKRDALQTANAAQSKNKKGQKIIIHETSRNPDLCKFVFFESTNGLQRVLIERQLNAASHWVDV